MVDPECDEIEPPHVAVEVLGRDAAPPAQEALDLAVAAVDRLVVHGAMDPLASRRIGALVRNVERRRDGRVAAIGGGDQKSMRDEDRLQDFLHPASVQRRQGMTEDLATTVGGDQDRHLLARRAALWVKESVAGQAKPGFAESREPPTPSIRLQCLMDRAGEKGLFGPLECCGPDDALFTQGSRRSST